jgi:hypothetical protein
MWICRRPRAPLACAKAWVALCVIVEATAQSSSARAEEPASSSAPNPNDSLTDAKAWVKNRPRRTEVELIDASKWDLGGTILPSAQAPFYFTDPFHAGRVGGASSAPSGYTLEWRIGWSFGRLSIEPIGGLSKVTGSPIPNRDGSTREASLSRTYFGGQLRYTQPFGRVSPFVAAGGTYDVYSSPLLVRTPNQGVAIDSTGTPSVHGKVGAFVRIASVAEFATAFFEAGANLTYTFEGKVFEESQIALAPYIGLALVGSVSPERRPLTRPPVEPTRDANERARDDAPRVEQECERGNSRSCEAVVRFWDGQETLSQAPVIAAVDTFTQSNIGIRPPALDAAEPRKRLAAAWTAYERVAFADAARASDQPGYEGYLARFPHGAHAGEAKQALVEARFLAVAEEARRTKSIEPVLDYLAATPTSMSARNFLVERGVEGLQPAELERVSKLDAAADSRFAKLSADASERIDAALIDQAGALPDEKAVDALHGFVESHPTSRRVADARRLEAERAFTIVQTKTGEDAISALASYRERYPNSPRAQEALLRERNMVYAAAIAAPSAAPMWRFLDLFPKDPQAGEVRDALAMKLSAKASAEQTTDYERFLERYPDHPKNDAITQRLRSIARERTKK